MDAQGDFKIESLSPNLLFRVLIAARGFEPATRTNVDPKQALSVRLKARCRDQLPANRTIFGRVLDPAETAGRRRRCDD